MALCLSNALRLKWQHVLYTPWGVDVCVGLKQVSVRDNNNCTAPQNRVTWYWHYINIHYYYIFIYLFIYILGINILGNNINIHYYYYIYLFIYIYFRN